MDTNSATDFLPNNGISIPAFEQTITLNTLQAQRVMERVFERAAGSLYRIDVILRIIGSEENAHSVENLIQEEIMGVSTILKDAAKQTAAVMEANGVEGTPLYNCPSTKPVRIVSPHVAQFLSLVRMLDKLVMEIDALWLSGIVDNKNRNEEVYRWQQKVMGLGSRIIGIERRARKAAKSQGKGDEVDAQAPVSEDELADQSRASAGKAPSARKREVAEVSTDKEPAAEMA